MKYKLEKFDTNAKSQKTDSVVVIIENDNDNHENLNKINKTIKKDDDEDDNTSNSLNEDEAIDDNLSDTAVVLDNNKSNKIEDLEVVLM